MQHPYLRAALVAVGGISLLLAVGLCLGVPLATSIWPWEDSDLPYIFLGAMAAAIGASLLWIGFSGELGACVGGALDFAVAYTILAIALFVSSRQSDDARFGIGALVCACGVLLAVGAWLWFIRYPIRARHPLPQAVRASFVVFVALLVGAGVANLLRLPNTYPWAIRPTTSVLVGSLYLGSACYFLYSLLHPVWRNAHAQLWGFLAYDVVLIIPLLVHFGAAKPALLPSLILDCAVLLYSGALAVYFLLINKTTREWHRTRAMAPQAPSEAAPPHPRNAPSL